MLTSPLLPLFIICNLLPETEQWVVTCLLKTLMGYALLCPTIISRLEFFQNRIGFLCFVRALQSLCTSGQTINSLETASSPS